MPSRPSQPCIIAAAGIASANRSAIAAFSRKVRVSPFSSVRRMRMPSAIPCRTQPVTMVASATSSGEASPGLVFAMAASHRSNCDFVKFPGIVESIPCDSLRQRNCRQPSFKSLFAARAESLNTGTGHFPKASIGSFRLGASSSHSRQQPPSSSAGKGGRSSSSLIARLPHSSGDESAAASVTRFPGGRIAPCPNLAGVMAPRPFP